MLIGVADNRSTVCTIAGMSYSVIGRLFVVKGNRHFNLILLITVNSALYSDTHYYAV